MKTILYSVSILFLLSSCGSGGDGKSTPAKRFEDQVLEAQPAADLTKTILPENSTLVKADLSYTEQSERFNVGCKVAGQAYSHNKKFDPKLSVGQVFQSRSGSDSLFESMNLQTESKQIVELSALKVVSEVNFLEIGGGSFAIDQIFIAKPHLKVTVGYSADINRELTQTDHDVVGNYSQAVKDQTQHSTSPQGYSTHCYIQQKSNQSQVDKIKYNLNGREVLAFRQTYNSYGDVICEKRLDGKNEPEAKVNMGLGRKEEMDIFSNEVVTDFIYYCGGTKVFEMERIILDSGKVVSSHVNKLLAAPLR